LKRATLRIPPGTYLTGALFLKSGMTLQLDRGATLLGSRDLADYPLLPTRVAGIEMRWPAALVNIYGEHDVGLVGEGCIDGDGLRVARPCEDITITDCIVREGAAGLTFGSETSGGFRRIMAERIAVHAPVPVGLLFKSAPTRGGFIDGVSISDLSLHDVQV